MEKIIRRDTLNEVFEVIDKHRSYFENLMDDVVLKMRISDMVLDDPDSMLEPTSDHNKRISFLNPVGSVIACTQTEYIK